MSRRFLALVFMLAALLGSVAELCGLLLPTLSWPFTASREAGFLSWGEPPFYWFGWLCMLVLLLLGVKLWKKPSHSTGQSELAKKWQNFKSIKRGYYSLILLLGLASLAALDQCIVGKRALVLSYEGKLYFPAFERAIITGGELGQEGNAALAEANYAQLAKIAGQVGAPDWVIMPPIPYAPSLDAAPFPTETLLGKRSDNLLRDPQTGEPYDGQASRLYPDGQAQLRVRFRKGLMDGSAIGWSPERRQVYMAKYQEGKLLSEQYSGEGSVDDFLQNDAPWQRIYYHPAPPLVGGHLLGTNSEGADIAAYLFGGLQVNFKAVLFYLPLIYAMGLTAGMLMGYIGGKFDLFTQRVIEILMQLPFLFVVMIVSDFVPADMRGMLLILVLLAAFGWMQMTWLIRSTTLREKQRDYIAASRAMGASTWRILTRHILPNLIAVLITLIPFSVATIILSLASLDYLGFGLPANMPSWGRLLSDGLGKLSCPWVVSAAFGALVFMLLLINFIGEAVREAFDPRRHSFYR